MSASPSAAAAFKAWKHAMLAAHYAAPCPDEVMDVLVEGYGDCYRQLAMAPAQSCDDLVLKLFPLLLDQFEPKVGEDPLVPNFVSGSKLHEEAFGAILADMKRLVPWIASALTMRERELET